jgi:hypothetical protein
MPAPAPTLKPLLTPQSDQVADVASLAGVGRGDRHNFNAFLNPFVFQEKPKLIERPRIRLTAALAAGCFFLHPLKLGGFQNYPLILVNSGA